MQGKILVAVGSRDDDEPIVQAHRWAVGTSRSVVVCHALSVPRLEGLLQSMDARTVATLDNARERATADLREQIGSVSGLSADDFTLVVRAGSPHAVVLEVAEEQEVSGIVVGDSRKTRLERAMLGSSASQIVRHARVPVLVARPSPQDGPVIVATDLSDPSMPAVEAAVVEAGHRSAPLIMVHCVDLTHPVIGSFEPSAIVDETTVGAIQDAAHDVMRSALERFAADGRTLVLNGSPKSTLAKACQDERAALLVVGTHGRSGIARIALGSVAESLTRDAPCSVLVVRST